MPVNAAFMKRIAICVPQKVKSPQDLRAGGDVKLSGHSISTLLPRCLPRFAALRCGDLPYRALPCTALRFDALQFGERKAPRQSHSLNGLAALL
jgi:hypothetical protein